MGSDGGDGCLTSAASSSVRSAKTAWMPLISFPARLDQHAAALPDAPAVSCGNEGITRGELRSAARRLARELAGLGVGHGDFVTVALPSSVDWFVAYCACWNLGAIPQPASPMRPARELAAIVEASGSMVVIGAQDEATGLLAESVHHLPIGHRSGDELSDTPLPDAISPAWQVLTFAGWNGRRTPFVSSGPAAIDTDRRLPLLDRSNGCVVMPGPLHHDWSAVWSCRALLAGNHVVIVPAFDAEATLQLIETHRADVIYVVPTMMEQMLQLDDDVRFGVDLSSLSALWQLAGPCPPRLKVAYIDWLGAHRIFEVYPGTDVRAGTIVTGIEWMKRRGTVGRVAFGEMRVCDDGNELPPGEEGRIQARSKLDGSRPEGPSADGLTLEHGWRPLGETGWFDNDGYLYLSSHMSGHERLAGAGDTR